jgi:hypothetical protein
MVMAGGDSLFAREEPKGFSIMTGGPACEAREVSKGFQTSARRAVAEWHANAYVTLGLTLATTVAAITVSIEIVRAAALL